MKLFHPFFHAFGYTAVVYKYPVRPRRGESIRFWENTLSHVGPDRWALDPIIPDPRLNSLPVWVPHDGTIVELKQDSFKWGITSDYAPYMNYVKVELPYGDEFYFIAHIKANSCPYKVGDRVIQGDIMCYTGVNGWMTDVRHLHFMVGRFKGNKPYYESLRIRWDSAQEFAPAKT